ncbi:MAG: Single-stranded DNA-binding protein [Chloroflexota bacterium]|jgi:single-strand DNA-binding protein
MASVNKVICIGNLGRDPETKFLSNGDAVCNFSIACSESWKNKDGEKQERTEWVRCVAYKKLAEICGEYLKKGSQVYIEGKMQTREWEKDGVKRYSTEVIVSEMRMLGGKSERSEPKPEAPKTPMQGIQDMEEDLPFANPYRGRLSYVV